LSDIVCTGSGLGTADIDINGFASGVVKKKGGGNTGERGVVVVQLSTCRSMRAAVLQKYWGGRV